MGFIVKKNNFFNKFITNWQLNRILKLGLDDQQITNFAIENADHCKKHTQNTQKDCRETKYKALVNNSIRNIAAEFFHKIGIISKGRLYLTKKL